MLCFPDGRTAQCWTLAPYFDIFGYYFLAYQKGFRFANSCSNSADIKLLIKTRVLIEHFLLKGTARTPLLENRVKPLNYSEYLETLTFYSNPSNSEPFFKRTLQ